MTARWEAIPFLVFAVALAATGGYTFMLGIRGDWLRIGFAAIQYGLMVTMGYEAVALWFRAVPTISHVTNAALLSHPVAWMVCFVILFAAAGALSAHFSVERRSVTWLVIVIGIGSYLVGAGLTAILRWDP